MPKEKLHMKTRTMAAVDLGAGSGRVLLARFDGQQLSLEEMHRFTNRVFLNSGVTYSRQSINGIPFFANRKNVSGAGVDSLFRQRRCLG